VSARNIPRYSFLTATGWSPYGRSRHRSARSRSTAARMSACINLAFAGADRAGLDALYGRIAAWPGVVVEFAPEPSGRGPKIHFIVREPSGIRIEFAFDPRV
jgi:hypothetical protein